MKQIFILLVLAASQFISCDQGPSKEAGKLTIVVECESMVCENQNRPGILIKYSFADGTKGSFLVCCKDTEIFMETLRNARKKACEDKDFSDKAVNAGGVDIVPYKDTDTGEGFVRLTKGENDFLVSCIPNKDGSATIDDLIKKIDNILPSCCIL
jgi:hypothetical protein